MGENERPKTSYEKFNDRFLRIFTGPPEFVRKNIVEPFIGDRKTPYYHRRYKKLPGVDTCDVGDQVCLYEHSVEAKREKMVEAELLNILRNQRLECENYYGEDDRDQRCAKLRREYKEAETNFMIKYGEMGTYFSALNAYMKQKHRMIWERRNGGAATDYPENGNAQQ